MKAILGKKNNMVQIYNEEGVVVPCTLVDVGDVKVVGKKTKEKDGYNAIILGIGKKNKPTKAEKGKYKEIKEVPFRTYEFNLEKEEIDKLKIGDEVLPSVFTIGDKVNVSGLTKGKGFQGVVKRHKFSGGPRTHGQSDWERTGGSIGAGTSPGRVLKGKKMPGHMGNKNRTIVNVKIVMVDYENKFIALKGSVPGSINSIIKIAFKVYGKK